MQYENLLIVKETLRAIGKRTLLTALYCPFAWLVMTAFVATEPFVQAFIENAAALAALRDDATVGALYLIVVSLVVILAVGRLPRVDGQRALCAFCVVYLPWATAQFTPASWRAEISLTLFLAAAIATFEELMSERLLNRLQG